MRSSLFAFCLLVFSGLMAPAGAQNFWGLQRPGIALNNTGIVEYQSRDWSQCVGEEQIQPQRAISACGRIIGERFSRDATASALYYRSVLYRQVGDSARAEADLGQAIELLSELVLAEPENPDYLNNLVLLRTEQRDFAGAAADYARVAALNRGVIDPRLRQGEFLFRAGDYHAAASAFDVAAQIDPSNAQAQSGRCETRAAASYEINLAQQACEEALRLSGQSASAYFSRGFFHFPQGRIDEALADFQAAGQKDNMHAFAAYGYAVASLRLGQHETEARELLTNVSAAVPEVEMYAQAGLAP